MFTILYVDDEATLLEIGKLFLESGGQFSVDTITSASAALAVMDTKSYDAIIADYQMPEMDGIEFLKKVRTSGNTIPFILFTGRGREEIVIQALNEGADFYLQKGGEPKSQFVELSHKIITAIERKRALAALNKEDYGLKTLVSFYEMTSGPLKDLMIFAVEQAVKITASTIGYLAFVSDDESVLTMYAWSSEAMKECHIHRKPIEYPITTTGLWGEAVRQRRPVITNDYAAKNPLKKGYPKGHVPIKRHMNIPVFDGSHIVMVAGVGNKPSDYDETDVHELSVLMSGLWNVIKQRRGEEELLKKNEDLNASNEQLVAAEEELRSQYDALAKNETLLRTSEEKIRESEEFLRRVITGAKEGIIVYDQELRIKLWNRFMEDLTGIDAADVVGKNALDLFPFHKTLGNDILMMKALEGLTEESRDFEFVIPSSGKRGWVKSVFSPNYDIHGTIIGVIGLVRDITERKKIEAALQKSWQQYREVIEDQTEFICRFRPDSTIVFVNDAYCRYFGMNRHEILGHRFRAKIPPEDRERVNRFFASLTPDHPVDTIEQRIIMPDGSIRWQQWSDRAIFDSSGTVTEYQSVGRDITEKKEADEAVQTSLRQLNTLVSGLNAGVIMISENNRVVQVNQALCDIYDLPETPEQLSGLTAQALIEKIMGSYVSPHEARARIQKIAREDKTVIGYEVTLRNGRTVLIDYIPIIDPKGQKRGRIWHIQDVTPHKREEGARFENEQRLNSIYNTVVDSIFQLALEPGGRYRFTSVNQAFCKITGLSYESIIGKTVNEIIPEPSLTKVLVKYRQAIEEKIIVRWEEISHYPTGELIGDVSIAPIFDKEGICTHLIGSVHDITSFKRTEEALRESEGKFRGIFDMINDGIHIHDMDPEGKPGKFFDVNEVACQMLQYTHEEMLELGPFDIVTEYHSRQLDEILCELSTTGHAIFETEHRRKDGTVVPVEINVHIGYIQGKRMGISVVRDITEHKQIEETLYQTNRKLSLLSGITRHDINNQLLILQSYLALLEKNRSEVEFKEFLLKAVNSATRIAANVRFAKEYESIIIEIPVWQECRTLVDAAAKKITLGKVAVINDIPPGTEMFSDPMVEKIFYNLIDNALRHGGGKLTHIRFFSEETDAGLLLVCEDDGVGISREDKKRLFERGFGKNTGMGLFLSREILSITGITIQE
ncbi:MAG: PAS domain S-box protein, partial [Methanoregula sp.]